MQRRPRVRTTAYVPVVGPGSGSGSACSCPAGPPGAPGYDGAPGAKGMVVIQSFR